MVQTGSVDGRDGFNSLARLRQEVEEFAEQYVPEPQLPRHSSSKVVHDGLWGTLRLDPHEVALLDTPLLQRLRHLRQTGLSFLTYPSTTHSRFEHTLGVVLQVNRLGDALVRPIGRQDNDDNRLTDPDILHMRLAALLHDVGHGPFSHTSEIIYGDAPSLAEFKALHPKANPHETLGSLILTSKRFRAFFKETLKKIKPLPDIDEIASHIVGDTTKKTPPYKAELLNGPFDADKLDYIFRDSRFSGLPLAADLDRLWYTVRIGKAKGEERLVVLQSGAMALEQVFFAKMVLFATVYQHHKVRACDCMFAGIIEYMRDHETFMQIRDKKLSFHSPADFLWITDDELMSFGFTRKGPLHDLIHDLYFRRLLKRAVVISARTVKKKDADRFVLLLNSLEDYSKRREVALEIWKKAGRPGRKEQVFLDLPKRPNFVAANDTFIYHTDPPEDQDTPPITLNDLIKINSWAKQYVMHRYRGHVFCPAEHRDKVARAASVVLGERYGIEFEPEAFQWCKLTPP